MARCPWVPALSLCSAGTTGCHQYAMMSESIRSKPALALVMGQMLRVAVETLRLGEEGEHQRAIGRMRDVDAAGIAPAEITGGDCAVVILEAALEHVRLFEINVLVQRYLAARRDLDQHRRH